MYEVTMYITVGDYEFTFANKVEVKSSWKELTDKATITLPKNLSLRNKSLLDAFPTGSPVTISLGYDHQNEEEFKGFVSRSPEPNIPFVLHCEDNMWLLKRNAISKSWKDTDVKSMLTEIVPSQFNIAVDEIPLGQFRIINATPAKVLEKLKETYGLVSYFQGDTLVVGRVYSDNHNTVNYHFQRNIINDRLEFKMASETKFQVTAISLLKNNKKKEVKVGDSGGEERTLHYYNITDENQLKALATSEMKRMHYDGFRGSLTSFGIPRAQHGDIASIADDNYPERSGSYYIDEVTISSGVEGFRREVELGPLASFDI